MSKNHHTNVNVQNIRLVQRKWKQINPRSQKYFFQTLALYQREVLTMSCRENFKIKIFYPLPFINTWNLLKIYNFQLRFPFNILFITPDYFSPSALWCMEVWLLSSYDWRGREEEWRMKDMYRIRDRWRMQRMPEPGIGCDWGGCWPGHGAVCAGHPEAAEEEGGHCPSWLVR